jgi:hypothetical protein
LDRVAAAIAAADADDDDDDGAAAAVAATAAVLDDAYDSKKRTDSALAWSKLTKYCKAFQSSLGNS